MKKAERIFKIKDIDCEVIIEVVSKKKDILDLIDEYIENFNYEWFDTSDESFAILYKDGSFDFIDADYDGHKIKKIGILSIIENNPCTTVVCGNFEINEYGVVTVAEKERIAEENIIEIA